MQDPVVQRTWGKLLPQATEFSQGNAFKLATRRDPERSPCSGAATCPRRFHQRLYRTLRARVVRL
ncbi:hypothetical protein RMSM_00434 [Rhodopirellula maiorica SM1]|uniref:Uncharacterized protein n=1 Tax=Rhodopirellula maiorica SM1 TaxID=1265738 RepID=M5S4T3_9BACT|nr:hypothetical protein RMSM_00434 [Rhodopirellula maiorica SM1]